MKRFERDYLKVKSYQTDERVGKFFPVKVAALCKKQRAVKGYNHLTALIYLIL